eukprot:SAG31_NODE_19269_length_607_cov_1.496063_1_plen_85_part_10
MLTADAIKLAAAGIIAAETLVWTEGMANWTAWGECKSMFVGSSLTDEQISDMMVLLDKDGDGEIDYREFARWFGRGPPPAPPTPE